MLRILRRLNTYRWRVHIPLTLIGVLGIVYVVLREQTISLAEILLFVSGWLLITGLGAAVGLHRIFAHRTHQLTGIANKIVVALATLSCEGPTIWWSAMHRGIHHPHSDTDKDIHSPIHGAWHSAFGWTESSRVEAVNLRRAPDLLRDPVHMWFHVHYLDFINIVWILSFVVSPQLFLWFFILPTAMGLWRDSLENVVAHTPRMGYRNFDTKDRSTNVWWLAPFGFGNAWHNNHHANPASFDFGIGVSGKWWELDTSRIFTRLLKKYERTTL